MTIHHSTRKHYTLDEYFRIPISHFAGHETDTNAGKGAPDTTPPA